MQFTAWHSDGFTERLLSYSLSCSGGVAELDAFWFRPEPPTKGHRVCFNLDPEPLVRALPDLRAMGPEYEASWDDLDHKVLEVVSAGETLRWKVYGGGVLLPDHPELRPWFKVWRWLEGQVAVHLPA